MSIDKPSTIERQFFMMLRACLKEGVSLDYVEHVVAQQVRERDEKAAIASSRSITDNTLLPTRNDALRSFKDGLPKPPRRRAAAKSKGKA